ncbi:MAG TPA: hypothetical protein VL961_04600, partial [Acidimicrobiales bacterium]|nr:hypothetical protein [Acidimicrobiales bacterium]
ALALAAVLALAYAVVGVVMLAGRARRPGPAPVPFAERAAWRMPALGLLRRPEWSRGRHASMYALSAYLVLAVVLLAVKAIELGLHHQG